MASEAFPESSNATERKGGKASAPKKGGALNNAQLPPAGRDPHAHPSHHKRNKHHGINLHGSSTADNSKNVMSHEDMYCNDD